MVVTGKVEPYTRSDINAKIESLGAVAGSSVTKKTDYLICGENADSKLDKARALGIGANWMPKPALVSAMSRASCSAA